jgi:glycosyltransferase involved in cell wall biosynthesis
MLRMHNGPNVFGALQIIRLARENGFSVIHSHGYKGNILLGFVPAKIRKIPMVTTLHGWTSTKAFSKMRLYEWLDGFSLRFMDRVVLVSESMLSNRRLRNGRQQLRTVVINNGVPADVSEALVPPADPIAAFCSSGFVVGSIGRLSPEKGHRLLVDAVHSIHAQGFPAKLVIIGEGPEREALQQKIGELGLEFHVLLPGYREYASRYLPFFDAFVLPSLTEGLPITILEAMRAGVPIVSTTVGGVPEVLQQGRAGILVPAPRAADLAEGVRKVISDGTSISDMTEIARKLVDLKYSAHSMAMHYCAIYEDVLRGNN